MLQHCKKRRLYSFVSGKNCCQKHMNLCWCVAVLPWCSMFTSLQPLSQVFCCSDFVFSGMCKAQSNSQSTLNVLWVYVIDDPFEVQEEEEDADMNDVITIVASSDEADSAVYECRCMACIWANVECTCDVVNWAPEKYCLMDNGAKTLLIVVSLPGCYWWVTFVMQWACSLWYYGWNKNHGWHNHKATVIKTFVLLQWGKWWSFHLP